jgi:hypothetical protein
MPPRDYAALAASLRSAPGLAAPLPTRASAAPIVGASEVFWVADVDAVSFSTVTATLLALGSHAHMWVQADAVVDQAALERSLRVFDERIYPTVSGLFGQQSPHPEGDAPLVILNAHFAGAAGYFAAANVYPRHINPYSNERAMFVMNLSALTPGTPAYESVLAHELQHLIHYRQDLNEDAWINEGASQLAEELGGYGWPAGPVAAFMADPDVQLTTWPDESARVAAHYGAAYLFLRYFWERTGDEALRALMAELANGLAGVQAALRASGAALDADDLLADWVVANLVNDPAQAAPFGYAEMDVRATPQVKVATAPFSHAGQVRPYGTHYVAIAPEIEGALRITFEGQSHVRLVPNEPAGGHYQWWSNRGDVSHSLLERAFDLSHVTTATLSYDLWFDIETGWDYAYVRASGDGGLTWSVLPGQHGSDFDPAGNALGWGYTGRSGAPPVDAAGVAPRWVRDAVDLSAFAGGPVLVRFDYVTDDAVNYAGLCLDNLSVDSIGYVDDVEAGEEEWRALGFFRHDNRLEQRYLIQLITLGTETRVERLTLDDLNRGEWLLAADGQEPPIERVLAITALAPVTTEPATYTLRIEHAAQALN